MQAGRKTFPFTRGQLIAGALVLAVGIWARTLLWQAAVQLFLGMLVAMAALPVMRRLEKKLPVGLAASLSMMALSAALIASLLLLVPPMVAQGKQLASMLPALYAQGEEWLLRAQQWLRESGIPVDENLKATVLSKGRELLSSAAPSVMARVSGAVGSLSKWMLAPVFAFYFLRDRKRIGQWALLLLPMPKRAMAVSILREMRRETAGFLRGQLMVSLVVGGLTAIGLLFCGVPAWLLLGLLMGVLELIPYAGPFIGGVLVLLFSLQSGLSRMLWAMGVVVLVQQLEGGMLSPQLMSDATRLHPIAVLLCVMLGGMAGGVGGILLAVPLVLCTRAALRVLSLHRPHSAPSKE
ncbi:MAG: AI-2E family transporter [Clostridia bacterium]